MREPRIYIKENIAYIHVVKLDGLNIFYTLEKEKNQWKVVKKESKKLLTVGSEVILEKVFLRSIGKEILEASKTYYGELRLFDSERIIDIVRNGFDTITMRVPGFEVIKYEHKDVSDITKIPFEIN
ncbi:hypothetical protein ACIQZI_13230 [Peribacillus sp. NPDC096379]|uniref:hypothetical protein n=1 Tax=Peribacillus sp. NPDC096379 TaxID=3364393 RepID=UPI00380BADCC